MPSTVITMPEEEDDQAPISRFDTAYEVVARRIAYSGWNGNLPQGLGAWVGC